MAICLNLLQGTKDIAKTLANYIKRGGNVIRVDRESQRSVPGASNGTANRQDHG